MSETQTPNEPNCEFCNKTCENGGNSYDPIETFSWEENRCCDECNLKIVIPTRVSLGSLQECHRCQTFTKEWTPLLCIYCDDIHPFCEDCLNEIDAYTGKYSKCESDDECGGDTDDEQEESDDESSDDE
ncbi:MAG: hypothetical protein ACOYLT_05545 [Flavobacterium sp.]|uniref:hypothetical protein n=1 Tax=Flavobacterium sp. TaxID=239 RepID=UPI003BDC017C